MGIVFAAFINGVARQPEARGQLQGIAFIGFALSEALAILGLVPRLRDLAMQTATSTRRRGMHNAG